MLGGRKRAVDFWRAVGVNIDSRFVGRISWMGRLRREAIEMYIDAMRGKVSHGVPALDCDEYGLWRWIACDPNGHGMVDPEEEAA
jgi:hypothetical protein